MNFRIFRTTALAVLFTLSAWVHASEDSSVEERLRRLEQLVEKQQGELEKRDQRIQQLETGYKHKQKIDAISEGEYFAPSKVSTDNEFKVTWHDGIRFDTADKRFRIKFGGRIMHDWVWASADDLVQTDRGNGQEVRLGSSVRDGTEFRRVRWYIEGQIYNNIIFKSQFDFSEDGEISKNEVWLGIKGLPGVGTWRTGQFKQPQGLEQLTSSKYITMMERSSPTTVFTASYKVGMMFNNAHLDDRIAWAASVYKPDTIANGGFDDGFRSGGGSTNFTGAAYQATLGGTGPTQDADNLETGNNWGAGARVTGTPMWWDDGKHMIHTGIWYAFETAHEEGNGNTKTLRFRERPGVHILDRYINTGHLNADNQHKLGAELAWVWGSASLQAEYFASWINRDDGSVDDLLNDASGDPVTFSDENASMDDLFFHGFYAQFSYFITGEQRPYKQSSGTFGRVKPKKNFWTGDGIGLGAWEVAMRFDYIDLDSGGNPNTENGSFAGPDEGARGGSQWSAVFGVNWYLNPNTRFMWNYVHTDIDWPHAGDINTGQFDTGGPQPGNSSIDAFMMRFQVDW